MENKEELEKLMESIASNMYSFGCEEKDVTAVLEWLNNYYVSSILIELVKEGKVVIAGIKDGSPTFKNTEKGNQMVEDFLSETDSDSFST